MSNQARGSDPAFRKLYATAISKITGDLPERYLDENA